MGRTEKFINPFTDYGFKRLFGEEYNKDLLMDFLNELLKEKHGPLRDITYLKNEQFGKFALDRRAIFDIYCESESGEKFIVEIQKAKQNFFKERSVYYATFPIQQQAEPGDQWSFQLKAVYLIGILDFVFDEDKNEPDAIRNEIKLSNIHTHKIFYDKLTFIYLQMPKFKKGVGELVTRFDKWLFILKNLAILDRIPDPLQEKIFQKLFREAEIANFKPREIEAYEESLKIYRDLVGSFATARSDGFAEGEVKGIAKGLAQGLSEGKLEIAQAMVAKGFDPATISSVTGIPESEIVEIRRKMGGK